MEEVASQARRAAIKLGKESGFNTEQNFVFGWTRSLRFVKIHNVEVLDQVGI